MSDEPVRWGDDSDEVIRGDLTVAAAYVIPAGGAVVAGAALASPTGQGRPLADPPLGSRRPPAGSGRGRRAPLTAAAVAARAYRRDTQRL